MAPPPPPTILIVGKNKGGVGATTVSRLLLEYLEGSTYRVFDGQHPRGSLNRFWPSAEVIDFASTAGRMKILDGMSATRLTFVDAPAGLLSDTIEVMRAAGFLEDVARGRAKIVVVHVLGPSVDSLVEAAEIAGRLADGGDHFIVRNCANDDRFEWSSGAYAQMLSSVDPAGVFDLAHLDATAREAVDISGKTFADFMRDETKSAFLRRIVSKWRTDAFTELNRMGFRRMIGA